MIYEKYSASIFSECIQAMLINGKKRHFGIKQPAWQHFRHLNITLMGRKEQRAMLVKSKVKAWK